MQSADVDHTGRNLMAGGETRGPLQTSSPPRSSATVSQRGLKGGDLAPANKNKVSNVRRSRPESRSRDLHAKWLILASYAWTVFPTAVESLVGNKPPSGLDQVFNPSRMGSFVSLLSLMALIAVVLKIIMTFGGRLPTRGLLGFYIAILPGVVVFGSRIGFGTSGLSKSTMYLALVFAVWVLRPAFKSLSMVAWLGAVTAVLSIGFALVYPESSLLQSRNGAQTKDLFGLTVLTGPFNTGNALGMVMALSLPELKHLGSTTQKILAVPMIIALLWSQSRTALLAAVVATVLAVAIRAVPRREQWIVGAVLQILLVLGAVATPLYLAGSQAFTGRGLIWAYSLGAWHESPIYGLGFDWYGQRRLDVGPEGVTMTQGHNSFVHSLTTGGLLYVISLLAFLAVLIVRSAEWRRVGQRMPYALTTTILVVAVAEVPLGFGDRWGYSTFATLPLLIIILGYQPRQPLAHTGSTAGRGPTGRVH